MWEGVVEDEDYGLHSALVHCDATYDQQDRY